MVSQDWMEKDFYAILGVSKDVDDKTLKKTYRKLAREWHPDSKPGDAAAEQKFKDIGEAYAVLSDPEQRKQYDAIRAMGEKVSARELAGTYRTAIVMPSTGEAGGFYGADGGPRRHSRPSRSCSHRPPWCCPHGRDRTGR